MTADSTGVKRPNTGLRLAFVGLLLVIAGIVGYFFVVFHLAAWLPSVRNDALPNWILVAAGVALTSAAVRRAPRALATKVLLAVDLTLAGLFAAMLYVLPAVPAATGPAVGAPAPDFALVDQNGKIVRLGDLRGAPVLLVFYRGHW